MLSSSATTFDGALTSRNPQKRQAASMHAQTHPAVQPEAFSAKVAYLTSSTVFLASGTCLACRCQQLASPECIVTVLHDRALANFFSIHIVLVAKLTRQALDLLVLYTTLVEV